MVFEFSACPPASPSQTCENVDDLPPVTFVMMGQEFTMTKDDYVLLGQNYDEVQCMTAFTPDQQVRGLGPSCAVLQERLCAISWTSFVQLIPGMELWIFGDAFIRAFYATFVEVPLHQVMRRH
jgi:hypothetical protein